MHSPIRSEAEVFKAVVVCCVAAAAVIVVGLIDVTAGAILAALLIGLALGVLWRRSRGSMPPEPELAAPDADAHRILVVANQTVGGRELLAEIRDRALGRRAAEVLVVAPALTSSRLEYLASDTDDAYAEAERRLELSIAGLEALGIAATGRIGDEDPLVAIEDALATFGADELIISTHPPERSRWLEHGVVGAARERLSVPITHVVVAGAASTRPVERG